jgi:hypothetical protein
MKSMMATGRLIGPTALLLAWTGHAHAQLDVDTTWLRTDAHVKGFILTVAACCNGGLRLTWQIPGSQPASTMTVDSPMNGTEVPVLVGGKPSGQTMAIKRVDDHHYTTILKMNGQPFGTSTSTISADNKTMTVNGTLGVGSQTQKTTETWVRQ